MSAHTHTPPHIPCTPNIITVLFYYLAPALARIHRHTGSGQGSRRVTPNACYIRAEVQLAPRPTYGRSSPVRYCTCSFRGHRDRAVPHSSLCVFALCSAVDCSLFHALRLPHTDAHQQLSALALHHTGPV